MTDDRSTGTSRHGVVDRRQALVWAIGAAGAAAGASPRPAQSRSRPARIDPVLFWSDTTLQLDALDHSVDAKDARAPGPCAASRALALAHIVMADACTAAYDCGFEGFIIRGGRAPKNEFADVFVGGTAARILGHIYTTPAHTHLIGFQRQHFLKHYDSRALEAWNAGLEFGRSERFTSQWHWETIKNAALSSTSRGVALRRGEHDVDPFNPDQKFYGVTWSRLPPLLTGLPIRSYGPGDPPPEQDRDYIRDLEEVRELGAFRPERPTADQVKVGVYWAYDGARLLGTPPRLYNQIVTQIAEADGFSTPELARLLALCNIAMADAGIVCWEAKYRYQLWRPVRGIPNALSRPEPDWRPFGAPRSNPTQFALGSDAQRLTALSMLGGGERNWFGEPVKDVLPYDRACFTPNFPSYPSGHATFGSACFNVLRHVRAERESTRHAPGDIRNAGSFVSDELNGITIDNFRNEARPYLPINYTQINQMIEDNNKSRVHLGVHWNFDCELGARSGARIAEAAHRNAYRRYR
ncbi:MAG: hypothetical protein K2Z80_24665 [Xanthobacteraceae bacterium]|nr:hypothetical protein [Xanthobacteraceae bacterium]